MPNVVPRINSTTQGQLYYVYSQGLCWSCTSFFFPVFLPVGLKASGQHWLIHFQLCKNPGFIEVQPNRKLMLLRMLCCVCYHDNSLRLESSLSFYLLRSKRQMFFKEMTYFWRMQYKQSNSMLMTLSRIFEIEIENRRNNFRIF